MAIRGDYRASPPRIEAAAAAATAPLIESTYLRSEKVGRSEKWTLSGTAASSDEATMAGRAGRRRSNYRALFLD